MPWKRIESASCNRCGVVQDRDQFYQDKTGRLMRRICRLCRDSSVRGVPRLEFKKCKVCGITKARAEFYPKKVTHGRNGKMREHYITIRPECKPCSVIQVNAWTRLKAYSLSRDEYAAMLARGCEICGDMKGDKRGLTIDHDHATGKVRGTLCGSHNKGLGFFQDSPALLARAIAYLEASKGG